MGVFLTKLCGHGWQFASQVALGRVALRGRPILDGKRLDAADFLTYVAGALDPAELQGHLQELNGFYSWVHEAKGQLRASVDHVRSFPLFYGQRGERVYLGDDADWVRRSLGEVDRDPVAEEEFRLAGYVTGRDTLYANTKQLQAGEYLVCDGRDGSRPLFTSRFYRFTHVEPGSFDEDALQEELAVATERAMNRLIDFADGRQIVVPLSGGFDSRLIVAYLKRSGYRNVLTFTYGKKRNVESEYSRKTAKAFGFDWEFVEYTNQKCAENWSTDEANVYRGLAGNHVSLPHVQDWVAIRELVGTGRIKADAIVVPGHTGDFVSGGHIPDVVFCGARLSADGLADEIVKKHCSNRVRPKERSLSNRALRVRVLQRAETVLDVSPEGIASAYECWEWQERQAKYIINSVRVYEQFGLDWWLPLWDTDFLRFWQSAPLALRKHRHFYKQWVTKRVGEILGPGMDSAFGANAAEELPRQVKSWPFLRACARRLRGPIGNRLRYFGRAMTVADARAALEENHVALAGFVHRDLLDDYVKRGFNIIGMFSDLHLRSGWKDIRGWTRNGSGKGIDANEK